MRVIETIIALRAELDAARQQRKTIGFVPTMGYLHEGHMSLVDHARQDNDVVVASIFVNPLQFGPTEDFAAYPRDLDADMKILKQHGCDILFAPSVDEMYPRAMATTVDVAQLGHHLCGQSRPTHFQGMATVVAKLFHMTMPNRAYFGQKDGQQVLIVRRMVEDLNMPVEVIAVPTVREQSGLAKSSRNSYLTDEQRTAASVLYRALSWAKAEIQSGVRNAAVIRRGMVEILATEPLVRLDYAEIVDVVTIAPVEQIQDTVMVAVAVYIGKARLIDNLLLTIDRG